MGPWVTIWGHGVKVKTNKISLPWLQNRILLKRGGGEAFGPGDVITSTRDSHNHLGPGQEKPSAFMP